MKIKIQNIRTFEDTHILPITPLTILAGENSAEKAHASE